MANSLKNFHPAARQWFEREFGEPTRAQELAWPAICRGESTLLVSPTGSGKTLAAFLAALDRVLFSAPPLPGERCRILYVSPLKALAVDVEKNLQWPLLGIYERAQALGASIHAPTILVRTGDTPAKERARFIRRPTDILITTPESLYLALTSSAREALRSVTTVIVDEVHAVVGSKRGSHLSLSLERLQSVARSPLQRIGLSATVQPIEVVARYLGGFDAGAERPVTVLSAGQQKRLDLLVESPADRMEMAAETAHSGIADSRSAWASIYPLLLELIRSHQSTLIFVNSRRLAERLSGALNAMAGEELVHAHHGSVAREQRLLIEQELKSGRLPALVATSSLELGIDMGAIDLVVQVGAAPSVSSGLQRIGRAGHQVGSPSKGILIPRHRGDLLPCAALTERMEKGAVESMRYPRNALDVLAQQIVAMVAVDDWTVTDLERVIRRAAPYAGLPESALFGVLDMLSGRFPSDLFAELRPRITWNRNAGTLTAREGARRVAVTSGGAIPDRGLFGVFLAGAPKGKGRVGELDEEMVFETRTGDVVTLGASSWRVEEITHDRVLVSPAPGRAGRMPFWHGDSAGRPVEFGRAIGALARTLRSQPTTAAADLLIGTHRLSPDAAQRLLEYLRDQEGATGAVPDDRTILIESSRDEMGDWRTCLLTPFGARVHAPWAMAIAAQIRQRSGIETDVLWTDDGVVVRTPESPHPPDVSLFLPDPDDVERLVTDQLARGGGGARQATPGAPPTALFASRFREAASRALLLPRSRPGHRASLWRQRKRAADMLSAISEMGSFPLVLETFRELLQDDFDLEALRSILSASISGEMQVAAAATIAPSPFAASVLFSYVANFIYEGDAPLAERRAQALLVDPAQLRELLGAPELRELLDPTVIHDLELELQHKSAPQRASSADAVNDLLLRLGDLSYAELRERTGHDAPLDSWLEALVRDVRLVQVQLQGEMRYIAVEDAPRYRDALGARLPSSVPAQLLSPAAKPMEDLVSRYARTHGPFTAVEAAVRWGIGRAIVEEALAKLKDAGRVVEGEIRPGGDGLEWCDAGVLRTLRQRTLSRVRSEVEPVEPAALCRFLLDWHSAAGSQHCDLEQALDRLHGAPLPARDLESRIIPARMPDFRPSDLDAMMSMGLVWWRGCGRSGPRSGRIQVFRADRPAVLDPAPEAAGGPVCGRILEVLAQRGASFFAILQREVGGLASDLIEALWDLVWAGQVTNDSLAPLRARSDEHPVRAHARAHSTGRSHIIHLHGLPADASGRWSLVANANGLIADTEGREVELSRQLLQRYGVVTREVISAERWEGAFSGLYPVLSAMEAAGAARRGYFVSGLGPAQFALPQAVERLRAHRVSGPAGRCALVAAADPANPYGAALAWPERSVGRKPSRAGGAEVLLFDGDLAAWLDADGHDLLTFDPTGERGRAELAGAIATTLAESASASGRRAMLIESVDGSASADPEMHSALVRAGFRPVRQGYLWRRGTLPEAGTASRAGQP